MTTISVVFALVGFVFVAPVLGCLIAGWDRIFTARLQGRVGPPLLQPLHDVKKLLAKEDVSVNRYQGFYVALSFFFVLVSGVIFFAGGNLLLVIFVYTVSSLFFIVAAYSTRSPFAEIGAEREIVQVMSYEPMIILMAVAYYLATGSFDTSAVFTAQQPLVAALPLVFIGLVFVLTIKLRKSPFDLSYSHHAHQELVKGITTEMSGRTLAVVEIMHWYETVLFLGWVALFLVWGSPVAAIVAVVGIILIYVLEVLIDNNFARVKWQFMLKSSWAVTVVAVAANFALIPYLPW